MTPEEYERRRLFCDLIKEMGRPEHIEIARILRKHNVSISENRSGVFFDISKLEQRVFEELINFHSFVVANNEELAKRDQLLMSGTGPKAFEYIL
jgi:hypothetical protein